MAREDRFGRGSDHSSFTQQGYPAFVFREANENFDRQHSATRHARRRRLRLPGAERARQRRRGGVAGAGAAGAGRGTSERGRRCIGRASVGLRRRRCAGRRRRAPSAIASTGATRGRNDWQHTRTVGTVTEVVLPGVSIDDFVFGVAAIGAGRPREPGQRLRLAGAPGPADRAGEVAARGWRPLLDDGRPLTATPSRGGRRVQHAAGCADSLSRRHPCWL